MPVFGYLGALSTLPTETRSHGDDRRRFRRGGGGAARAHRLCFNATEHPFTFVHL